MDEAPRLNVAADAQAEALHAAGDRAVAQPHPLMFFHSYPV